MPQIRSLISSAFLTLAMVAGSASAAVILDNSSFGRYNSGIGSLLNTGSSPTTAPFPCDYLTCGDATVNYPTAPDLSAAAVPLGNWLTNPASPGGTWTGPQAIPMTWTVNDETAIIYEIAAGAGLTDLSLWLGVDNGVFVWLDGTYLFGARAAGGSALGEYSLALANLSAGTHYLQILREDHGGGTGFDIRLTGTQIPEPGTLALVGLALLGASTARRRRG